MKNLFLTILVLMLFCGCSLSLHPEYNGSFVNDYSQMANAETIPDDGVGNFSTMVVADLHFGRKDRDSDVFYKFPEIQEWYRKNNVDISYTFCLGDSSDDSLKSEFVEAKDFLDSISDGRFLSVLGNHDIRESGRNIAQSVFGTPDYFRIERHGISFYFVDNSMRTLGHSQLNELISSMKADKNPKVVLTHYPIYPEIEVVYGSMYDMDEVATLTSLFSSCNVRLVLSAHYHRKNVISQYSDDCTELVLRPCHGRTGNHIDTTPASWYILEFDMDNEECKVIWFFLEEDMDSPKSKVLGVFPI